MPRNDGAIAIIAGSVSVICTCLGFLWGGADSERQWRRECVLRGVASYSSTGEWQWMVPIQGKHKEVRHVGSQPQGQ
jgi:hypothetical protein